MEHKWEVIQTDPLNPTSKIIWGHNRGAWFKIEIDKTE